MCPRDRRDARIVGAGPRCPVASARRGYEVVARGIGPCVVRFEFWKSSHAMRSMLDRRTRVPGARPSASTFSDASNELARLVNRVMRRSGRAPGESQGSARSSSSAPVWAKIGDRDRDRRAALHAHLLVDDGFAERGSSSEIEPRVAMTQVGPRLLRERSRPAYSPSPALRRSSSR